MSDSYGEKVDNRDQQPAPPADGTVVVTTDGAAGDNPANPAEPDGDGAAATSDGATAEATVDGSSPASAMDVDSDNAVGASGFHQTNITPPLSGPSNIDSTVNLLHSIVNKDIAKLDSGEIAELSPQTMELMSRLVSLAISESKSSSPAASVQQQETSVPSLAQTFADFLSPESKRVVITSQDVKQVPRLTGSADVDVISVIQQYRLVCRFRLKAGISTGVSDAE